VEAIRKSETELELLSRVESPLEAAGFRVVDLECRVGPRSMVRLFIERQGGMGIVNPTVSLEDCATATRLLEACEGWDDSLGRYELEVSSPGLDRRLRFRSDFESRVGEAVRVWLWEKLPGSGEKFRGTLVAVDGTGIEILVDSRSVAICWSLLRKAEAIWEPETASSKKRS
jgi:ribosome maturation factor RimP